jgi:hypothetical protein
MPRICARRSVESLFMHERIFGYSLRRQALKVKYVAPIEFSAG